MMKTRRKSRQMAAAAAEPEPSEQDAVSEQPEQAPGPSASKPDLTLSIPDDVDVDYLLSLFPDASLETPSADFILSLYRLVVSQAADIDATTRDLEEARAEIEKKDVELDQALQDKESSSKDVETELESLQKDLKMVKQERDELLSSKASLQGQITKLTSSQSVSSTELDSLKHKVEDTEREKRDLVAVVSRLKEDSTQRDEEIQTLRTNLKQSRHEYQSLETQLREVRSSENAMKFRLDSLSQQLQLAKDEAERSTTELTAKSDEFAKYRHAKHAELSSLQSAHDALVQTHASTEGTLRALQSANTAQSQQLAQALARVQDLTGRLAEQEATYASEAAGLRRLVEMMEEREAQAKSIVENIENEWAGVGERAERREAALRAEVERERKRAESAEDKIEEMERVLEHINRGEYAVPSPRAGTNGNGSVFGTPSTPVRNGANDPVSQGMMMLSPSVAMASRAQKGGKTFTEVYTELIRMQEQYSKKSDECDHLDRTLQSVLAQIEERAPILAQQRAEYERLQTEASELSAQLSDTLADRDAHATEAREASQKLAKTARENDLLQKQLNDLGRQIQVLLKELGRQQDPSIPSDAELALDAATRPAENAEEFISNNLVLFRSLGGLQEQNQKLLRIVREMGAKMEAEEREYRDALEKEQSEAVREAHDAIQALQAQLENVKKSSETKIQAYVKESESLRSMLTREQRAAAATGRAVAAQAESPAPNGVQADESEIAKEFREMQGQFEVYRTETSVDSGRLREELAKTQKENGSLGAALAKANAKLEFMGERQQMAQEQYSVKTRELDDLTKRHQQLYDRYTRIDIECNRVTEDLVAANGRVEQMRNECANLRAEKKIWESIQVRLVDENKALSTERAHLSDLMANVQKMHSDLERSGENDRRRLESQIQMLDNQSQDLRTQLTQERETLRHLSLQKEVETKELHARIDKSVEELAKARESLIKAETSRKHFEERCEELSRKLQGNEEKLAVYERRPSTNHGTIEPTSTDGLSREQQLEAEVAELRSALKVAEVDLANARSHAQQFQEISQANEEALATLNASYDEYKASVEAQLNQNELNQTALQANLQTVQTQLNEARERFAEATKAYENDREAWTNDKKTLEDTIVDLTTSQRSSSDDRTAREAAVREQEERVKAAEEKYSREVVAHAEDIKAVEELRQKLADLQSTSRGNAVAAETAQAKLASSEASWAQQKQALEKELADLNERSKELTEQNKVLHQHLDSVSSQAARIRQAADASATTGDVEAAGDSDAQLSELRAVIGYLRREKEILEMQLELGKQENARLKTQIGHLTRDLDETKTALSEERERAVAAAATDAQHAELVEKINQLTLLRESNATLRVDVEANAKRARALDIKLRTVTAEVEPLREQLRIAQAELEARTQDVGRLQEESAKWQQRNTQLLSKYDRIDPSEVQGLKEEIERLKTEKTALESSASEHAQEAQQQRDRIEKVEHALKAQREVAAKNVQGFRQRMGIFNNEKSALATQLKDVEAQLKTVTAERDALKESAGSSTVVPQQASEELEKLRQEKAALEQALQDEKAKQPPAAAPAPDTTELDAKIASLTQERDQLLAEKTTWEKSAGSTASASTEVNAQWEAEKVELTKSRDEAVAQAKSVKEEADKAKEEARELRLATEKFQARLQEAQKSRQRQVDEQVKAALEKSASATAAPSEELVKKHAEELRNLESRLTAKHKTELEAAVAAAEAKVKAEASSTAPALSDDGKAAVEAAIAAREAELKAHHAKEVSDAIEQGRSEISMKLMLKDRVIVNTQNRIRALEQQIEQLKGGNPASPSTPTPAAKSTPASKPAAPAAAASSASAPGPSTAGARPRGGAPAHAGGLPRKPGEAGAAPAGAGAPAGRGRGRGTARGGLSIRGTANSGHAAAAAAGPSHAAGAGGVSIMGAAGKRAREESDTSAPDSLAKRLKPADGSGGAAGAGAASGGSKPVTLQRNRVGPS